MRKNLYAGFSIALTIILIGLLLVRGWLPWPHNSLVRVLLALALMIRLGWFVVRRSDVVAPEETALGKPIPELPSARAIGEVYSEAIRNYEQGAVNLFVEMLTDPTHYLDRITEFVTIEPDTPRLRLSVHQVYQLGHTHGQDQTPLTQSDEVAQDGLEQAATQPLPDLLLVPIIWTQRGTLIDHFRVTDASGEAVQTLSYNQTRGLMAYALESLIDRAELDEDKFWGDHPKEWFEQQRRQLVNGLVVTICSPGPLHRQPRSQQERIRAALGAIDLFPFTDDWRTRLKDFCLQYLDRYVIVAEVRSPEFGHLGLTYSHFIALESPTNYPFNQWRERFGLSPSTIDIVHNPFFLQVDAYHLEIAAQPEQYVFDHHLEWIDTHTAITQSELRLNGIKPYVRLYYEEGRPNAHLYVRSQATGDDESPVGVPTHRASPQPRVSRRAPHRLLFWKKPTASSDKQSPVTQGALSRVKSVVQFREVPPGALGGATAVAVASAAIITFFALTRLGLGETGRSTAVTQPTDIPALLLVLPGFVTVVLGSWIELSRLKRASLTTYLALAGTMLFSLIGALYYLYGTGRNTPGEFTLTIIGTNIHISTDAGWLTLMIIAVTHALFLVRQVISESRYYFNCVRRRVLEKL